MIATLTRIYKETRNEKYLLAAINKGWITEEKKNEIIDQFDEVTQI